MLCMQFLSIFLQANEIQVIADIGKGCLVKIMWGWCSGWERRERRFLTYNQGNSPGVPGPLHLCWLLQDCSQPLVALDRKEFSGTVFWHFWSSLQLPWSGRVPFLSSILGSRHQKYKDKELFWIVLSELRIQFCNVLFSQRLYQFLKQRSKQPRTVQSSRL